MSVVGKLGLSLFFLVFLAMGSLFTWLLLRDVLERAATRGWQETPCHIEASAYTLDRAGNTTKTYAFTATYTYTVDRQTYRSSQVAVDDARESRFEPVQRLLLAFPAGSDATCYVKPGDPGTAVLRHASVWTVLVLPLPLVFVLIGGGGIGMTWLGKSTASGGTRAGTARGKMRTLGKRGGLGCVFTLLLLVGLGVGLPLGILPGLRLLRALSWQETPAVVEHSQVRESQGDDGSTYDVDVLYRYQWAEQTYRSNDYAGFRFFSSGYDAKREIVARYPAGSQVTCYVNPKDPVQAMLSRQVNAGGIALMVIPALVALIGLAGLMRTLIGFGGGLSRIDSLQIDGIPRPESVIGKSLPGGAVLLKTRHSRLGKLIVLLLVATIFGIAVFFMGREAVGTLQKGRPEVMLLIMTGIFGLVVLGLLIGCVYQFLALFNPTLQVSLAGPIVYCGGELAIRWRLQGDPDRLRSLTVTLKGEESASYQRGTRSYTDTHTFAEVRLLHTTSPVDMRRGGATLALPIGLMHSLDAPRNKVTWSLDVQGDVPNFPDLQEHYDLVILPCNPKAR